MATVTLGLPVYNGERFLAECLDSILGQTFEDFELLVSDNASTDATYEICLEYARRDSRIRLLRQARNIGAAANFNVLFEEGRAPYFKWCAHDDLLEPRYLESVYDRLEADPTAVLAHSHTRVVDVSANREHVFVPPFEMQEGDPAARLRQFLSHEQKCYEVFGLIRSDVLARTQLIGSYRGGDNVLLARLALLGPFRFVPEPLFVLRRHAAQSTELLKDTQAYQAWFRGRSESVSFPDWVMARHMLAVADGLDLSFSERLRVAGLAAGEVWRRRRQLRGNLTRAIKQSLGASGRPPMDPGQGSSTAR